MIWTSYLNSKEFIDAVKDREVRKAKIKKLTLIKSIITAIIIFIYFLNIRFSFTQDSIIVAFGLIIIYIVDKQSSYLTLVDHIETQLMKRPN